MYLLCEMDIDWSVFLQEFMGHILKVESACHQNLFKNPPTHEITAVLVETPRGVSKENRRKPVSKMNPY